MTDILARLDRLESEAAIRRLKAAYLNACDAKDPRGIAACFMRDARLDYPPIGEFGVDGLISAFTQIAMASPIADCHQAHNAEIDFIGPDHASARWNLGFSTYDPRDRRFRIIASFYHDEYRRIDGRWLISTSRHQPRIIVDGVLAEDAVVSLPQSTRAQ